MRSRHNSFSRWSKTLFVDIHNHILPGIDDGAPDMAYAVRMARQAVRCGTDTLVATPHRAWRLRRGAPPEWVRPQVEAMQAVLDKEQVPLRIVPGIEIPLRPSVADELTSGVLGTLGDAGTWALVEPPFDRVPSDALESLRKIRAAGFGVVLAHPERNAEVQRGLGFIEGCAELGLAFQLTTGSLLGRFGPRAQAAAEAILAHAAEWPLVISSDSHDLDDRPTALMDQARDVAARIVGEASAQEMVDTRPRSFLQTA